VRLETTAGRRTARELLFVVGSVGLSEEGYNHILKHLLVHCECACELADLGTPIVADSRAIFTASVEVTTTRARKSKMSVESFMSFAHPAP
jgi:hypothetical protein